jgi:hypothetical protein
VYFNQSLTDGYYIMENNKLQNAIAIFELANGQHTLNDIKQVYRKLASANHPDKGGNTETMQIINTAFAELCKFFEAGNDTLDINEDGNEAAKQFDFSFISELKTMHGVIVEVCGYWIWLTGDTFTHHEKIKALGFKFSGGKKAWYWSPTINETAYRRGSKSLKNIRKEYGSSIIKTEQQAALTAH